MKVRFWARLLVCVIFLWTENVNAADLSGREIMDMKAEHNEKPSEYSEIRMTLIEENGDTSDRLVNRFARKYSDSVSKSLMTFNSPKSVKGVASLSWDGSDGKEEQWTFLPAMGKLKRVVGGGKRSYFMGTDFANEDLTSENRKNFDYNRLDDAKINEKDHFVVEAVPNNKKTKKNTGYNHRHIYVDKETFLDTKIDFFERRSKKLIKTLTVLEAVNINGNVWKPKISMMENFKEDHKTRSEFLKWKFDEGSVSEKVFEHRYLKRKKHMR